MYKHIEKPKEAIKTRTKKNINNKNNGISIIQMAPPTDYKLKKDNTLLDTDIKKWKRPRWYNNEEGGAAHIRERVWERMPPNSFTQVTKNTGEIQLLCSCPYCTELVSFMGSSVEHKIDWAEYAKQKGARTVSDLYYYYHDLDNLIIVHSGCNSSAKKKSPEEIAMRDHYYFSPATWGASEERSFIGKIVYNLKSDYQEYKDKAPELLSTLDNILLKYMSKNSNFNNTIFKLKELVGDDAFNKAKR